MADSTCLIHGFSYASAIPNESKQGNPMHVLGESISFGRFMNESLSWERWSTFSPHKKYVEEAQRYAQPGSVAQKKVFFEAHYKKIAAQKAAALLEQENAYKSAQEEAVELSDAVSAIPQQTVSFGSCLNVDVNSEVIETEDVVDTDGVINEDSNRSIYDEGSGSILGDDKPLQESPVKNNSISHSKNLDKRDSISVSESSETTSQVERPLLKKSVAKEDDDDEEDDATSAPSKKRTSFSLLRSSIQRKAWRVPPSTPVNLVPTRSKNENTLAQHTMKSGVDFNTAKNRSSPKSLSSLISLLPTKDVESEVAETEDVVDIAGAVNEDEKRAMYVTKIDSDEGSSAVVGDDKPVQENPVKNNSIKHCKNFDKMDSISVSESSGTTSQIERPLLKNSVVKEDDDYDDDATSAPSKKTASFSSLRSSIQRKAWRVPPSTPVNLVTTHSKKENDLTQQALKLGVVDFNAGENRSSPKSLGSLISLLPTKDPDNELISSSTKQTQNLGYLRSTYRVPTKDHPTPSRTLLAGKISSKYAAGTPQTENKRLQTPVNPSAPGGKTGPRRHIFSAIYSKSLSACRNKLQSPTLSSPFILRTEERAAKRKQKLEEKFNASEVQRVQQQKTSKDKAGDEIRKLGCGFCFKARPLPDFYKEREPPKNHVKKIEAAPSQPSVPVKGTANKKKGTASMPPPPPPPPSVSAKNSVAASKPVSISTKPLTTTNYTLGERIAHENESPNIQL